MNQLQALRDTVRIAQERGMPELPGSDIGLEHLRQMADIAETSSFSPAKLGRWLGWAQCAVVAANIGVTLEEMKALNLRHATGPNSAPPQRPEPTAALRRVLESTSPAAAYAAAGYPLPPPKASRRRFHLLQGGLNEAPSAD